MCVWVYGEMCKRVREHGKGGKGERNGERERGRDGERENVYLHMRRKCVWECVRVV